MNIIDVDYKYVADLKVAQYNYINISAQATFFSNQIIFICSPHAAIVTLSS